MPYGYLWWIVRAEESRRTFMASGWGGQLAWVHPPLDLVVATTSSATPASQERGHAAQLLGPLVRAAALAPR
jgi:CubicO group peptidase (beta-lactamase class C family)